MTDSLDLSGHLDVGGGLLGISLFAMSNVTIHDLTIENAVNGIEILVQNECVCTVRLENVTLGGLPSGLSPDTDTMFLGAGLRVFFDLHGGGAPPAKLVMKNVKINGFDVGMSALGLDEIAASDTLLENGIVAVDLVGVHRISFSDCLIQNFRKVAFSPIHYDSVAITRCTIARNALGVYHAVIASDGSVSIDSSRFDSNALAIALAYRPFMIKNSTFTDNGVSDLTPPEGLPKGGIFVYLTPEISTPDEYRLVVRNSAFEGNQPFAIRDGAPSSWVDARENWWGSAMGPSSTGGDPVPAYAGDAVDPTVRTMPFLDSPPGQQQSTTTPESPN